MNLIAPKQQNVTAVDTDALLQDSYLLAVELRLGGSVQGSLRLTALCVKQVESVQRQLKSAGLSQRHIDYISHAQCALLDETVLTCTTQKTHADWAGKPLQARFFSRHQAGESLYEDLREALREPVPDLRVLTVFQRVLMLGFKGCYADTNDPARKQLLAALNTHVAPLKPNHTLPTQPTLLGLGLSGWARWPEAHVLAVCALLAASWWGLDHLLGGLIASLPPSQA